VLLLGIVVLLPVWGLVRHSLFITYSLPAYQPHKAATPHYTHSSRIALEVQRQSALSDQHGSRSLTSSQGRLGGDRSNDVSSNDSHSNSGSGPVERSTASILTRNRKRQQQVNEAQQQQGQNLGETHVEKDKGQVQEQGEQAQEQKVNPGRLEQDPKWSRRMMVLPGSEDSDAADAHLAYERGPDAAAGSSSAGVLTPSVTRGTGAHGVLTSVDEAAREAQAERRLGAGATGSERGSVAAEMGRGVRTHARLFPGQPSQTEERGMLRGATRH